MKPLFGNKYLGIFEWKTEKDAPALENGQIAILNKDVHWSAIYKKNNKKYEFDSFGRDLLGKGFADAKMPKSFLQPFTEANCGQRTAAWLIKQML